MVKVGLDIHGVIDEYHPMIIHNMLPVIEKMNGEIHIITGSSFSMELVDKLMSYANDKVWWSDFFSINDYLLMKGLPHTFNKYGRPVFDDVEWDKAKGDYCAREEIGLHIDDTLRYKDYFTTPFVLIDDFIEIYKEEVHNYLTKNEKSGIINQGE